MEEILAGNATPAQLAAFLWRCGQGRDRGRDDRPGRGHAGRSPPRSQFDGPAVDVVGSGGDRANTVNVSTMAAIVAAGAGATVVKHGNRAASSACGAADVLEALGVVLDLSPGAAAEVVGEVGIVFLFAPLYHPGLRHAGQPRRSWASRRTFNFLGPLANPAQPVAPAVGVADPRMAELMAGVLPPGAAPGSGLPRRRRAGRADHDHHVHRVDLCRRAGHPDRTRPAGPRRAPGQPAGAGGQRSAEQRAGGS